jgi:DNA invertase Pin-like site-specific DNA recombinase
MKAFAYVRFSSDPQEQGTSIERQTESIKLYLSSRPHIELENTFVDDGYSASKGEHLSHGHFGRILKDVDSGKNRGYALIVEKMDRFSRMDIDETADYIRRLTKGGVEFHLAATSRVINPPGKQLGTVIQNVVEAWQAEDYVKNLTANVIRGWKRISTEAANGRVLTRNVPEWLKVVGRTYNGAKILNAGKIVEIPEKVAVVREIFRLAGLGVGTENIARQLNGKALSRSWIVKTLCNRAVLGEFCPSQTGEVNPNYFPAIITQGEFDAARQQINTKSRHGKYIGGYQRRGDMADNLFSGLLFDVTSQPVRTMQFQQVHRGRYLMSAFDKGGRKQNRINYDRCEQALLSFFSESDFNAIASEGESEEVKTAKGELDIVLSDLDKTTRLIATKTAAMEDPDLDMPTLKVFAAQIAKAEIRVVELSEKKEPLTAKVNAALAKSASLYDYETFLHLIEQNTPQAHEVRLRLRAEIAKRVSRIDLDFTPREKGGVRYTEASVTFVNGHQGLVIFRA